MNSQHAFEDGEPKSRRILWAPKRHKYNRCISRKEIGRARKKLLCDAEVVVQLRERDSIDVLGVDRWIYLLRKRRCSMRRQMQHMDFRRYFLKTLAEKKFAHILVTRCSFRHDNNCRQMFFVLFVGGKKTQPMLGDTGEWFERRCKESFQNAVLQGNLLNIPDIMSDSFFWRNNCTDRNSSRGVCNECRIVTFKPDLE